MKNLSFNRFGIYLLLIIFLIASLPTESVAISVYQEVDPQTHADTLFQQGQTLFRVGELQAALLKFEVALSLYRAVKDRYGEALCLLFIGDVKNSHSDHPGALDAYQASLSIWQEIGEQKSEGTTLHYIASIYSNLGQYDEALYHYAYALAIRSEIGDKEGQADTLMDIGFIYANLGQYDEALDYFQQALAIRAEVGNYDGEFATLNYIGTIYLNMDKYKQALDIYQQSLMIAQKIRDREGERDTLSNIGFVYRLLGQYENALMIYQQALAIAKEIRDGAKEGITLHNIGMTYQALSQFDKALDYYQQALTIIHTLNDTEREVNLLYYIGSAYYELGESATALNYYQQAMILAQNRRDLVSEGHILPEIALLYHNQGKYEDELKVLQQFLQLGHIMGDQAVLSNALDSIATAHLALGQNEKALTAYQEALTILQQIGDQTGAGATLNNIGSVYWILGYDQKALDNYRNALSIARNSNDLIREGVALSNIGGVYADLGQYDQALENYQQALKIASEIGDKLSEGARLVKIGVVYSKQGKYKKAFDIYQQSLTIMRKLGSSQGQFVVLGNIGFLYKQIDNKPQAIVFFQQAVKVMEDMQNDINIDELKASLYAKDTPIYQVLIDLLWEDNRQDEAFNYAERARARAFLNQIGNHQLDFRKRVPSMLIAQEQALLQKIISLQTTLMTERAKTEGQQNHKLQEQLSSDLEQARTQHEQLITQLKLADPEYASLVSVSPLSLSQVQTQVLDSQTTLIEYFVMDGQALAWVIDKVGFKLLPLTITRKDLTGKIRYLGDSISTKEFDDNAAAELYNTLFAPLKPYIHHTNLIIVPHDTLHYLPFAALKDGETGHYLVQDYTITYAPTASVLKFVLDKRNPNQDRLLAMGNPDHSLPNADSEVKSIAQLYNSHPLIGGQATESQIYTYSSQIDILHLAAHGVYDPYNPLYTRIELAADASNDGNLEVHEVYGLDLTGVNLVVLSACDTALGQQSRGDELVGLTRAFLYAGTPAVITTLWSIDDKASSELIVSFYKNLRSGLTVAEALRRAQIEVLAHEEKNSPYYWAAFSLTGDYQGDDSP